MRYVSQLFQPLITIPKNAKIKNTEITCKSQKQYLTSKLSRVLVQSKSSTPLLIGEEKEEIKEEETVEEDDLDQLFDNMETVGEKPKRKIHISSEPEAKKIKPSAEGSTIHLDLEEEDTKESTEEDKAEAIKKLLKSTEKQKKRLEKKKKQKKAKSLFHNA